MTAEEIEAKARAEYEAEPIERGQVPMRWDALPEFRREEWRRLVRKLGPHPKHLHSRPKPG